ncbi:hypothetical protein [Micromonospora purpureochromogenes]|uniref:DUF4129 domain-containing protein n=1 Tax=Micromonospora purpureochromogenes TaxID=47872 RepID=A0ABX2RM15_9ACTN|nr:hypothetical protein [Micromonospora purpureochromogenes]NYF57145.1 hypothetical protein [Micromonospora purpureochromogenes]
MDDVRHVGGSNGRRYLPVPCPQQLTLGPTRLAADEPVAQPEPYEAHQLSHREAARLIRARSEAEEALAASHPALREAGERLIDAWHQAKNALHPLAVLVAERELQDAAREKRRNDQEHADDGAEDRRSQPAWQRPWVIWAVILVSAIYDTVFFATSFRDAIDAPDDKLSFEYWISYVPGFSIAMALILSGSWLAVPLFRHRSRADRRRWRRRLGWRVLFRRVFVAWRPEDEEREREDLPWPSWPLPVGFASLVVGVLGMWAWLRGDRLPQPELRWPLVGLLVLLTIAAIAFKASSHNPYADRKERIRQRRQAAVDRYAALAADAEKHLAAHAKTWQEFYLAVEDAAVVVRRHLTDAWTEVAEARARHGLTGMVAPGFPTNGSDDLSDSRMFEGLAGPALRVTALRQAVETLNRYRPEALAEELDVLRRQLNAQLAAGWRPVLAIGGGPGVGNGASTSQR